MRKRIVIALLAIVVIGIGAFAFTRAREDSIDWHKKEYFRVLRDETWSSRFRAVLHRVFHGSYPTQEYIDRKERKTQRLEYHKQALMRLGYLEDRVFIVSNRPPSLIAQCVWHECGGLNFAFCQPGTAGPDGVRIVGTKEEMPKWEALVRRFDTLENRK